MNWKTIVISYGVSLISFISYFLGLRKPKGSWFKAMKPIDKVVLILSIVIPALIIWNDVETESKKEDEINNKRYFGVLNPTEEIILPYDRNYRTAIEIGWSLNRKGATFIYNGGAFSNVFKSDKHPYFKVFEDIKLQIRERDGRLLVSSLIRANNGFILAEIIDNEWKVAPPPNTLDRNYTDDILEVKNLKGEVVLQVRLLKDRLQLNGVFYDSDGNGIILQPGFDWALMIIAGKDNPPKVNIDPIFVYPSELHLGELSSLNANDAAYWNYKGDALFRSDKTDEALKSFNKAVELNPYNAQAWYNKLVVLLKIQRNQEFIKTFNNACKYFSSNKDLWYLSGVNYGTIREYKNAINCYDKSLMLEPNSITVLNSKAETLNLLSKSKESLEVSYIAFKLDSLNPDTWYNISVSLMKLNNYVEGLNWINKVLLKYPKHGSALANKGAGLLQLGKTRNGLTTLLTAVVYFKHSEVYFNIGNAYSVLKEYKYAISYYDSCLLLEPNEINAYFYRGIALDNVGKFKEAINDYNISIKMGKEDGEIYFNRGISNYKLGRKNDACNDWWKAFKTYKHKVSFDNLLRYCKDRIKIDTIKKENPALTGFFFFKLRLEKALLLS